MSPDLTWLTPTSDGGVLTVKATPRANRSEVAGAEGDWLRVRVKAPPVDGKANAELIAFLAKKLNLPKNALDLVAGDNARLKRIRVRGLPAAVAAERLLA